MQAGDGSVKAGTWFVGRTMERVAQLVPFPCAPAAATPLGSGAAFPRGSGLAQWVLFGVIPPGAGFGGCWKRLPNPSGFAMQTSCPTASQHPPMGPCPAGSCSYPLPSPLGGSAPLDSAHVLLPPHCHCCPAPAPLRPCLAPLCSGCEQRADLFTPINAGSAMALGACAVFPL